MREGTMAAVMWMVIAIATIGAITVGYLIKRLEDVLHKKESKPDCLRRVAYGPDCPVVPVEGRKT